MKITTFNQIHKNLGAKMVPYAGFEMPVQYAGVNQEHMIVRNGVGVFDVSHMGQFFVKGPEALELLQYIGSNDASKVKIGQAQYTCLTNENGGIIDDLIIYRMSEDEWMLVVNASNIDKDWEWINKQNKFEVEIENRSDQISLLAIQGPKAIEAMQALTNENLEEIPFYNFKVAKFAGADDVIISATGYTGSGGFEIYFDNKYAEMIWEKVMEAGREFGIEPCGLAARDTLRLEKGFCLYGNEINENISPLEAGLGWITKLNKDFIGKEIIAEQKEKGIEKKLIGFKIVERGVPRQDYKILDENENEIGVVTSGTQSPVLKEGIGMGYVETDKAQIGNSILIQVRNKTIKAEIVKTPFV